MKFLEVGALEHVIVVDDIVFPPEFHLLMPDYHCLQIVLDEVLLVLHVHVVDHVFHVERGTHQTQRFYILGHVTILAILYEVSHQIISTQTHTHHVDWPFGVVGSYSLKSLL